MSNTSAAQPTTSPQCPSGSQICGPDSCAPISAQCCGNAYCINGDICAQSEINPTSTFKFCIAAPTIQTSQRPTANTTSSPSSPASIHNSATPTGHSKSHTAGQVAGIAVGSIAAFVLLVGGLLFLIYQNRVRRKAAAEKSNGSTSEQYRPLGGRHEMGIGTRTQIAELEGSTVHEAGAEERAAELEASSVAELDTANESNCG
jgi:hypothetical protein